MASEPLLSSRGRREEDVVSLPLSLRRKVAVRLLPYLFLIYIIAFLDRVNISYAVLEMKSDLGFSSAVLGLGMGIFFWGYFLLEIPSTVIVERWSARKWMSRIMVTWGLLAVGMGFLHTARVMYLLRFLLGAAEAGFFPGIIVYLGHWFTKKDKAKAVALFMAALPVSFIIGAPISGSILNVHWLGLHGWRWIFIMEGIPAIVAGIANLWILTDRPHQAEWLTPVERQQLQSALDQESEGKASHLKVFAYATHPVILLLTLIYFLTICASYGFGLWLPMMIKRFHFSDFHTSLLAALPYVVSLLSMIAFGWNSDRTGERRWHTAIPFFIAAAGLSIGSMIHVTSLAGAMLGFCLVGFGIYSYMPSFWAVPSLYLSGTAMAVATGFINSFANLGGFVGPFLMGWVQSHTGSFSVAMGALLLAQVIAGCLVFTLRPPKPAASV